MEIGHILQTRSGITRRDFLALCGVGAMGTAALLTGCVSDQPRSETTTSSSTQETGQSDAESSMVEDTGSSSAEEVEEKKTDTIVVYFSRAGENYEVGTVETGNTAVVAQMIAEQTGADIQEIVPATAYPASYDECLDQAKAEQNRNDRPALATAPDIGEYTTVYLGYPLWWRDLPMCVYTYLESQDWTGKTVAPFCTYGGSGLMSTEASIRETCAGATVLSALGMEGKVAQFDRDATLQSVKDFVGSVGA